MLVRHRHHGRSGGFCHEAIRQRAPAFTLIELLVVIAIIAILAALLLPTLNRAKQAGYGAACKSNLHQLGIALLSYVPDFNAYPIYAVAHGELPGPPPYTYWHDVLEPYSGAIWDTNVYQGRANSRNGLYICPATARLVNNPSFYPDYWPGLGSYGMNDHGVGWGYLAIIKLQLLGIGGTFTHANPALTTDFLPTRANQVLFPSRMIAIGDTALSASGNGWGIIDQYVGWAAAQEENPNPPSNAAMVAKWRQRHDGRWNVLFCDGHIETLKTKQLFDSRQDEVLKLWNYDHQPHRELLP